MRHAAKLTLQNDISIGCAVELEVGTESSVGKKKKTRIPGLLFICTSGVNLSCVVSWWLMRMIVNPSSVAFVAVYLDYHRLMGVVHLLLSRYHRGSQARL